MCNRARGWLALHQILYQSRDIFSQPLTDAELRDLAQRAGGAAAIFSWRSPSARPQNLDQKSVTENELFKLMLAEPRLIRRPLLLKGDVLAVGAEPKSLEQMFGGGNRT